MDVIRGLHNLRPAHRGCVATIGNFDGVHLGHQAVLGQLAEKGAEYGLPTTVVTFEPHPQEFFTGTQAPPRLTRFREKALALQRFAVARMLCLHFDAGLAALTPQAFIDRVLCEGLAIRYLVVGDDFRFGSGRGGDFALLEEAGRRHGFAVAHMHTFEVDGARVSSTRIRAALGAGDLDGAAKLLGRPYRMRGRVAHGDHRGRDMGFPTANLHLHRRVSPLRGVFAIQMFGVEGEPLSGVANIGSRPTVDGTRTLLEVHLLDYTGDLYGRHVAVDFLHRIRDERRFASIEALKRQIGDDIAAARAFFTDQHAAPASDIDTGSGASR